MRSTDKRDDLRIVSATGAHVVEAHMFAPVVFAVSTLKPTSVPQACSAI